MKKTKAKKVAKAESFASGYSALLKSAGLKSTQGRIGVLDVLIQAGLPQTVEQLSATLGSKAPDRATLYRIVDQFVQSGLAKEIHFNDSVVRYEINGLEEHDHCCHHVVCKNCGLVAHIESNDVEKAISKMTSKVKAFAQVDEHTLEFFGVCNSCAK